jgi:hypothetical protein
LVFNFGGNRKKVTCASLKKHASLAAGCVEDDCPLKQREATQKDTAATHPSEEIPVEIREKATEIIQHGDPIEHILGILSKYHAGDRRSAELLLCSLAIGNVLNAFGTQPKLSGGSGKGKTHLCRALKHLIAPEWIFYTSLTPKSLFYATKPGSPIQIKPGTIIFSDDVRVSEDMEDLLKRSMTNFQEPTNHLTINKEREVEPLFLPERLIWWLTSVQDDQEEQLLNRFFSVGVDESENQDRSALNMTFAPLIEGRAEFPITEEVQICWQIIREIKSRLWIVKAPFLRMENGELAFEWMDPSDRRNPGRFCDILAAYTVLRFGQRRCEEREGYTVVEATPEDFSAAKTLFESRAENLVTKLSDRELHFLNWLKTKAGESRFDFELNDLCKSYRGLDGKEVSSKSLERLLLGRIEKGRGTRGLMDKLKGGIITVEKIGETNEISTAKKHQRNYRLFSFDPSKFKPLESYSKMVRIKTDIVDGKDPKRPGEDPSNGSAPGTSIDIDFNNIIDGKDPKYPKRTIEDNHDFHEKDLSIVNVGSSGDFGSAPASDAGSQWVRSGSSPGLFQGTSRIPPSGATVRFLQNHPAFMAEDLRRPGEIMQYGPFMTEDVATLPETQARILVDHRIAKLVGDIAVEVA